jgi:hypothetical protein
MVKQNPGYSPRNYELQEVFFRSEQERISNHLFGLGVVSRLIEDRSPDAGVKTDVNGVNQLDKLFVPCLTFSVSDDGEEKVLSLVAITPYPDGRSYTYFRLGVIGLFDTLYPFPGVDFDDAQAVNDTARELITARDDGLLPNLDATLLSVHNPNTSISIGPHQ